MATGAGDQGGERPAEEEAEARVATEGNGAGDVLVNRHLEGGVASVTRRGCVGAGERLGPAQLQRGGGLRAAGESGPRALGRQLARRDGVGEDGQPRDRTRDRGP